jgi:NitT/TauT family transport system permease protein
MSMSATAVTRSITTQRKPGPLRKLLGSDAVLATISILVMLAIWQAAVMLLHLSAFILPAPTAIIAQFLRDLTNGAITANLPVTLIEVLLGFIAAAAIGVVLGAAIALVPVVEKCVYPSVLAMQTVPKVAIAPLLIIWFGFGLQSKVVTAALIAFFPVLVNVIAGLRSVDPRRLMLMQALRATPWQCFLKVRLPSMLPFLFAGLEIGLVFSIIGVIVGEFIGSSRGLGVLIIQRQGTIDVPGVFSVLIYLSLIGLVLNFLLVRLKRRLIYW